MMDCEYFGKCGSCTLGENTYEEQLTLKVQREKDRFNLFYDGTIDVIKSLDGAFRNRAEFRVFHKAGDISYAMNDINKKLLPIQSCSIVSSAISQVMDKLLTEIKDNEILSKKFFSVEFLSSLSKDLLVTMIYHKKLDNDWSIEATKLQEKLKIKIIGRSRKQKVILTDDVINEKLMIKDNIFNIKYQEGGFTQPNQRVNIQMIEWVLDNIETKDDLCELYCGGGNFTLPLSKKFNKVLATEISKTSIKSAKINCELNDIDNIKFIRMSSEEFVEALQEKKEFRRLKQEDVNLTNYNFSTIFVDPPRAGLDDTTRELCKKFKQIIYISCNPQTLHRDLEELTRTHTIKHFALFDQFAFSHHIECGVILEA
jgi:tRNA (uracil-5-)-methyltransferase